MNTVNFTRVRIASSTLGALLIATSISACDTNTSMFRQSVELHVDDDGGVSMAVCEDSNIDGGRATIYKKSTDSWSTFWEADGQVVAASGTIGEFGKSPFGLKASIDEVPSIEEGDKISIYLYDKGDSNVADNHGGYVIEDPEIVRGHWMDNNLDIHDEACTR